MQGKDNFAATHRRTAEEESLRPNGQRIDQQSHEGTRWRSSNGVSRMSEALDHSLHPSELWPRYTSQSTQAAWGGRRHKRNKTGITSLPHVKLAPMSPPGPTGERQEHVDATIAIAGAGQKGRLFRVLDVLTAKWATGDIPERMPRKKRILLLK